MKSEEKSAQQVLDDYIAARRLEGTIPSASSYWSYKKGWYKIGAWRYRRKQLEEMTAVLRARVTPPAPADHAPTAPGQNDGGD